MLLQAFQLARLGFFPPASSAVAFSKQKLALEKYFQMTATWLQVQQFQHPTFVAMLMVWHQNDASAQQEAGARVAQQEAGARVAFGCRARVSQLGAVAKWGHLRLVPAAI